MLLLKKKLTIQSIARSMLRQTKTLTIFCFPYSKMQGLGRISFPQLNTFNQKFNNISNQGDVKKLEVGQATSMLEKIIKAVETQNSLFNKNLTDINTFFQILPKTIQEMSKEEIKKTLTILNGRLRLFRIKKQHMFNLQDALETKIASLIAEKNIMEKTSLQQKENFERSISHQHTSISNMEVIEMMRQLLKIKHSINNKNNLFSEIVKISFTRQQFELLCKYMQPESRSNVNSKVQIQRLFRLLEKSSAHFMQGSTFALRLAISFDLDMVLDSQKVIKYCEKVMSRITEKWELIKSQLSVCKKLLFQTVCTFLYCLLKLCIYHKDHRINKWLKKTYDYFNQMNRIPIDIGNYDQVQQAIICLTYAEKFQSVYPEQTQKYAQAVLNSLTDSQVPEKYYQKNVMGMMFRLDKIIVMSEGLKKNQDLMVKLWNWKVDILERYLKQSRELITYIRVIEFLALISDNVLNVDKSVFISNLKQFDQLSKNYRNYQIIRLWAVMKKMKVPSKYIQRIYQHLKNNQPDSVLENLTRTFLYSQNITQVIQVFSKTLKNLKNSNLDFAAYPHFWKFLLFRSKYLIDRQSFVYCRIIANDIHIYRLVINFLQAELYNINPGQFQICTHFVLQTELPPAQFTNQLLKISKFGRLNDTFFHQKNNKIDSVKVLSFFKYASNCKEIVFSNMEDKVSHFKYLLNILKDSYYDKELTINVLEHSIQRQIEFNKGRVYCLEAFYRYIFHQTFQKGHQFFLTNPIIAEGFFQNFQNIFQTTTCVFNQIQLLQALELYISKQKAKVTQDTLIAKTQKIYKITEKIGKNDTRNFQLVFSRFQSTQSINQYSVFQIFNLLSRNIKSPNLQVCWRRVNQQFLSNFDINSICILLRRAYKSAGLIDDKNFLLQLQKVTQIIFKRLEQQISKQIKSAFDHETHQKFSFSKQYLQIYSLFMRKPHIDDISQLFTKKIGENPTQFLSVIKDLLFLNIMIETQTIKTVLKYLEEQKIFSFYNGLFPEIGQSRLVDLHSYLLLNGDINNLQYFYDKVLSSIIRQQSEKYARNKAKANQGSKIVTQKMCVELLVTKMKFPKLRGKVQAVQGLFNEKIFKENILNYCQHFQINQEHLLKKSNKDMHFEKVSLPDNIYTICILKNTKSQSYQFLIETYNLLSGNELTGHDAMMLSFLQSAVKGKVSVLAIQS